MRQILTGLGLVAVSVGIAIATLAVWLKLYETQPAASWIVFMVGFAVCAASALVGIWILLGAAKGDKK